MRRDRRWIVLIGAVLWALALAGCGILTGRDALAGTSWELARLGQSAPLAGTSVTLAFQDGRVSGSAGCNHYSGAYQVKGDALTVGPLASTEMACLEPEGAMDQEALFLASLSFAQTFRLRDGQLELICDGQVLTFRAP